MINKTKYEEVDDFDLFLHYYNHDLLELDEIDYKICERFSSLNKDKYQGIFLNRCKLYQMFLESINSLGDNVNTFYKNIDNLKIKRTSFSNGYAEIVGNNKEQTIYLTKKRLRDIDFIAFSHEMGHIPTIKNGAFFDYFEYSETMSIFFEYLSALYLNHENAFDVFLNNRLEVGITESLIFLEAYNIMKNDNSITDKFILHDMRDSYKYIISLEYALNLIDLYNNDRKLLRDNIDKIICGMSSFKEFEIENNLDIKSYKKLKKYI